MTDRPGRNLLTGTGIAAVLFMGVFAHTAFIFPAVLVVIVLAVLAERDRRQARHMIRAISVRRTMPVIAARDRTFDVELTVTNSGTQPLELELRDVVPQHAQPEFTLHELTLRPGVTEQIVVSFRIAVRGQFHFGPVWARVVGPLRLMESQQAMDCPGVIQVLPETFASSEELVKDTGAQLQLLDKVTRTRRHGVGTEFESLHAFRDGDDPRRIDWRATARMRQPIVRRFQVERHRDVMILIDTGRLMGSSTDRGSKLDCAVDAALNLSRVALQSGDRCGVAAWDSVVRGFLPPVSGIKSLNNIVQSVYDLQTRWEESDFTQIHAELQVRQAKRCLLVVLSDVSDAETSRLQCAALQRLSRRHLVLFAALRTPALNSIIRSATDSVLQGAEKAVAFRLLRDRSRALHVLERSGVHVLDVEPQQLTLPLINRFVALRQRNLL